MTVEDIQIVESALGVVFPKIFKTFMSKNHGAYALIDAFDTENENGKMINNLLSFDKNNKYTYFL